MPKQVIAADKNTLANIPLPIHGSKYTVVSHKFIIDEVLNQLNTQGFTLDREEYKMNLKGEVAQGVYHLKYGNDPDMGLMFAWANSYDKTMRFRCAIGGYVFVCSNGIIAGDMSNYGRKHTGDAKEQVKDHIKSQIGNANVYFNNLVVDKDIMKTIILNESQVAKLMGTLYFKEEIITSGQLIAIKAQYAKPAHGYNAHIDSLWTIYNHITYALKKAHPKTWMEQQKDLHAMMKKEYFPNLPAVNPNQTSIIDEIDEREEDEIKDADDLDAVSVITEEVIEEVAENDNPFVDIDEPIEATDTVPPFEELEEVGEEPVVHVENDLEYAERVAAIDEVPEPDPEPEEEPEDDILEDANGHGDVIENGSDWDIDKAKEVEHPQQIEDDIASLVDTDAANMIGDTMNFPKPPSDLPVLDYDILSEELPDAIVETVEMTKEEAKEKYPDKAEEIDAIPLEEQIASETTQPISEEEKVVSAEPIVDEPVVVEPAKDLPPLTNGEGILQPNPGFEEEISEPLNFDTKDDSEEAPLEAPDFEF